MSFHVYVSDDQALSELGRAELGVIPIVVGGVLLAAAAIGAALGISENESDWADKTVFTDNMRKLHSAMLGLQCVLGGAQAGSPLVDSYGATICPGGTKPHCTATPIQLARWRTLRDGFGAFWASSTSGSWSTVTPSIMQLGRQYFSDFKTFYRQVQPSCLMQGAALPELPAELATPDSTPTWVKYATWGVGFIAVIALANSAKSIFGGNQTVRIAGGSPALGNYRRR